MIIRPRTAYSKYTKTPMHPVPSPKSSLRARFSQVRQRSGAWVAPTPFEPNFAPMLEVTQPRYVERGNSLCRVLAPSLAHTSPVRP